MSKVIVTAPVSRRLRELTQGQRELILKLLNQLYYTLEDSGRVARHRSRRNPEDPDQFLYRHAVFNGGRWRTFEFSVNDTMATDHLFVVAVSTQ